MSEPFVMPCPRRLAEPGALTQASQGCCQPRLSGSALPSVVVWGLNLMGHISTHPSTHSPAHPSTINPLSIQPPPIHPSIHPHIYSFTHPFKDPPFTTHPPIHPLSIQPPPIQPPFTIQPPSTHPSIHYLSTIPPSIHPPSHPSVIQ